MEKTHLYFANLVARLRDHFALRCGLTLDSKHPYYTSIAIVAKRSGLSKPTVRSILVLESRYPTGEEFDALLLGLNISIRDLLHESEQSPLDETPPDARTSSLELNLRRIDRAASLLSYAAASNPGALKWVGEVQEASEAIAAIYGLLKIEKIPKKVLPEY